MCEVIHNEYGFNSSVSDLFSTSCLLALSGTSIYSPLFPALKQCISIFYFQFTVLSMQFSFLARFPESHFDSLRIKLHSRFSSSSAPTIKHILIDCIDFDVSRRRYSTVSSRGQLFVDIHPSKMLLCLKEIGLFYHFLTNILLLRRSLCVEVSSRTE